MCKCKAVFIKFIQKDWSLSEKILVGISLTLVGILAGFIIAPIKQGIKVNWALASHNGSRNACGKGNKDNKGKQFGKKAKQPQNDKKEEK